jgi:putative hydrolase of the HAD superfamily
VSRPVTTIAFDADDTLWHHEEYYQLTEASFALLLADFADHETIASRLIETERRNIKIYGYGVKGFTLSMIETAIEITEGRIEASAIKAIIDRGHDLIRHPIEPMSGAYDLLASLKNRYCLLLITKGDLFDQERKLAQSGLGDFFDAVEIVAEKDEAVYRRVFARHGDGAATSVMIGNSLKSDILPALAAGAWGIHVPSARNWVLDHAEMPENTKRFLQVKSLAEIAAILPGLDG